MGADYHIYLHGVEGGQSLGDKTKPFSTTKSGGDTPFQSAGASIKQGLNIAKSPLNAGASMLTKALPAVAIIAASASAIDKVLTIGFSHLEEYTGKYEYNVALNNVKGIANAILNPANYVWKNIQQQFQFKKQNEQINEQNKLLGTSVYKNFHIGV